MRDDRPFLRRGIVLFGFASLALVIVTDAVVRNLGGTPADFSLFVGRFHPLAVHLPIGILLLVAAGEVATLSPRLRERLDPAIALALPVLVAATVGTFVLGQLLARAGDFAPRALTLHRRLELVAALGICLSAIAWAYQEQQGTSRARLAYRSVLTLTLVVLSVGAHFGGTLTRGDGYLAHYAPGPFKRLLGGGPAVPLAAKSARPKSREPLLYADVIQPIFSDRCVSCHGPEKAKAGLRVDSLALVLKGGEDGSVLTPGEPEDSTLIARLLLPEEDEDHMPPEGKPQLTPAEIATIRFWVERGAKDTLAVRDLLAPVEARPALEHAAAAAPAAASASAAPPAPPVPTATPSASAAAPPAEKTPTAIDANRSAPGSAPDVAPGDSTPDEAAPPAAPTPGAAPVSPASGSSARAILAERCAKCHGAAKQKAKLRLDSLDALLRGGKSGPAVAPGDPSASLLIERATRPLVDEKHMPPAKEAQLTPSELSTLASFVRGLSASASSSSRSGVPASARGNEPAEPKPASGPPTTTPPAAPPEDSPAEAQPPAPEPPSASAPPTRPDAADPALLASLPTRLALYPARIAPLLSEHCEQCHSGAAPAGGLAIAPHAALLRGGDTGPALTPKKPAQSLLVRRISLPADDSDRMPPAKGLPLSTDDIALVTAWVEADGSADQEVALATLPAAAVRALAAHPPARASTDVALATPRARDAGCGACATGTAVSSGGLTWSSSASLVALALSAWRVGLSRRVREARRAQEDEHLARYSDASPTQSESVDVQLSSSSTQSAKSSKAS